MSLLRRTTALRPVEEIRRALAHLQAHRGESMPLHRGKLDTLAWALGDRAEAPVTGRVLGKTPAAADAAAERVAAEAGLSGDRPRSDRTYLIGVQNTAAWLPGGSAGLGRDGTGWQPLPVPPRRMRPAAEYRAALRAWLAEGDRWYEHTSRHYRAGVLETLRWAAGERHTAPASDRLTRHPLSTAAAESEQHYAHEGMTGERHVDHSLDYLTGVENAAAWLPAGGDGIEIPRS